MRLASSNAIGLPRVSRGLTITELLVAVSMMTVIVLGLYSMFAHTQRALRANLTQVDVLESGRAAIGLIRQEIEELAASDLANRVNIQAVRTFADEGLSRLVSPTMQFEVDEQTPLRTNLVQEVFFLTKITNSWTGIGYRVMEDRKGSGYLAEDGVGTLYRYSFNVNSANLVTNDLLARFSATWFHPTTRAPSVSLNRVADGVMHFHVSAYDGNGNKLDTGSAFSFANAFTNFPGRLFLGPNESIPNSVTNTVIARPDSSAFHYTEFYFLSNALPSYLEVELGVLEPETYKQYQSLRGTEIAKDFLQKRASKVHLFRERIPVRTAAP